jgi:uncharacterized membrane protein YjfL (UPF0719 family)
MLDCDWSSDVCSSDLVEKQNMALGLVVAAMSLGISIIVAAAIHG